MQQPASVPPAHEPRGSVPLPRELHDAIAALVADRGEPAALRTLGLPRQTVYRCLAGLPVRRGTIAQIRAALDVSQGAP